MNVLSPNGRLFVSARPIRSLRRALVRGNGAIGLGSGPQGLTHLPGAGVRPRRVPQRQYPHQFPALDDRKPPNLMLFHELASLGELHVRSHRDRSAACDITGSHLNRILPFGQDSDHRVAIGDQSNRLLALHDGMTPASSDFMTCATSFAEALD